MSQQGRGVSTPHYIYGVGGWGNKLPSCSEPGRQAGSLTPLCSGHGPEGKYGCWLSCSCVHFSEARPISRAPPLLHLQHKPVFEQRNPDPGASNTIRLGGGGGEKRVLEPLTDCFSNLLINIATSSGTGKAPPSPRAAWGASPQSKTLSGDGRCNRFRV